MTTITNLSEVDSYVKDHHHIFLVLDGQKYAANPIEADEIGGNYGLHIKGIMDTYNASNVFVEIKEKKGFDGNRQKYRNAATLGYFQATTAPPTPARPAATSLGLPGADFDDYGSRGPAKDEAQRLLAMSENRILQIKLQAAESRADTLKENNERLKDEKADLRREKEDLQAKVERNTGIKNLLSTENLKGLSGIIPMLAGMGKMDMNGLDATQPLAGTDTSPYLAQLALYGDEELEVAARFIEYFQMNQAFAQDYVDLYETHKPPK